jgi:hypothetical protein
MKASFVIIVFGAMLLSASVKHSKDWERGFEAGRIAEREYSGKIVQTLTPLNAKDQSYKVCMETLQRAGMLNLEFSRKMEDAGIKP